jgi:hypothetical protein
VKNNNFTSKKQLPVSTVAMIKPWASSCELTCSQSSSLIAKYTVEKKEFNNENTTLGTSTGYEQALSHQL